MGMLVKPPVQYQSVAVATGSDKDVSTAEARLSVSVGMISAVILEREKAVDESLDSSVLVAILMMEPVGKVSVRLVLLSLSKLGNSSFSAFSWLSSDHSFPSFFKTTIGTTTTTMIITAGNPTVRGTSVHRSAEVNHENKLTEQHEFPIVSTPAFDARLPLTFEISAVLRNADTLGLFVHASEELGKGFDGKIGKSC